MLPEKSFDTGIVTLNYAEGPPAGPALVLLHGGSATWQSWEPLLDALTARWHVYAPDLRGHGKSGRVAKRYRLQDYADDIIAFVERNVAEPAILFGHSLGGMVGLIVAAQRPTLVRALMIGDSPLSGETWYSVLRGSLNRLASWRDLAAAQLSVEEIAAALRASPIEVPGQPTPVPARDVFGADAPWFTWMALNLSQQDPDVLTALIDDFDATVAGYDIEQLLPVLQCPVLLLQAAPDQSLMGSKSEVVRALTLLAHPTHIQLAGVGHPLHSTHPAEVLQAILPFLAAT
jgi:pimeloyl-ACP methyl ester carboxylesterase